MTRTSTALTNWAGNLAYTARTLRHPRSVDELQEIVARSSSLRVLGSRHSFNGIADTPADLVSLDAIPAQCRLSGDRSSVDVSGAVLYGDLSRFLDARGCALRNMASLPHISVAGACATATHGSGVLNRCLSAAVNAMEIVAADGEIKQVSRQQDGEIFDGMAVHLGGLGAVTHLTLEVVPSYSVQQDVYENLPFWALNEHVENVIAAGYSVSLFTNWKAETFHQVWVKRLRAGGASNPPPELFGARLADGPRQPIPKVSPASCTQQACPGPGTSGCRIFGMSLLPATAKSCKRNISSPARMLPPRFRLCRF